MIDDDFDFDQPVTRIPQNEQRNKQLGNHILKEAQQYLEAISADEHAHLIQSLKALVSNEPYFEVLAEQLDQPLGEKVANDALNLLYFWRENQNFENAAEFKLLDVINGEHFQTEMLKAFEALEIGETKAQRRLVILEALKLYKLGFYAGCIPILYSQLEGTLTEVLLQTGFLKQNGTKFVDVYKIVPGLKGNEIKSLWHKSKIACELNRYFAEINAYKMDSSSVVTATRHNILHGTDVEHFNQERSFILFIWLFSAVSFMSTVRA
ncbi:glycosyltransferase family 47 protein [Acinetobacter faecalis]|uniref:hypothetical protein n=1 Tax=Acinetobacter faecalis TaxID=2665161 RepID=UPI002A908CC8|nr:hypothetical protein [Acinetobacter faecalis]MDY6460714.1 hypothetical protein [Acinetobacter faecalis]MDY6489724.1 hypothetical protein [Acinetobacter faecalis]MDY6510873.1 hypothetical protein [Acinetobacter faecalis]MDY6530903.1 hypothetical protein [Acinetobacter faecalis]